MVALVPASLHAQATKPDEGAAITENGPIPEIIVTAQRRSESLQKAAASISVRNGADLLKQGKVTLRQMLEDVPGLSDATQTNILGPAAGTYIVMRGLASDQNNGPGINPSGTAVYVDGVFEGFGGTYDIERVEVLRGPQGTLYGRSATAGVVSISTVNPTLGVFSGNLTGEYGTDNLFRVQGAVNVPLGDKLALRVSGQDLSGDGYDSKEGQGRRHITDGRAKLLFKPTDTLDTTLAYAHQNATVYSGGVQFDNIASGYCLVSGATCTSTYTGPKTVIASSFPISPASSRGDQVNGTINWSVGGAVVSYLGSYQTYRNSTVTYAVAGPPGAAPVQSNVDIPLYHTTSHELHIASGPGAKITWIGGVIYYRNRLQNSNDTFSTASGGHLFKFTMDKTTRDLGVFGQTTIPLGDRTRITAGIRYDSTQVQTTEDYTVNTGGQTLPPFSPAFGLPEALVTASLRGNDGLRTFNNVTFKGRIEHDLGARNMVYGLVATGFLPGDVRVTTVNNQPLATPYDQQTLTSFEAGTKNRFLKGALTFNASAYYNKYTGYQISTNVNAGIVNSEPNNVFMQSPARMYGFELDSALQVTRHDRLTVTAGYTNARFVNKPNTTLNPFATNFVKDEIPGVAPWTVSSSLEHTLELGGDARVTGRINGVYTGAFDIMGLNALTIAAEPLARQPGHVVGNLDVTVALSKVTLTAYVRNFTGKRYITHNIGFGNIYANDVSVGLTDPRTFGVVLSTRF